MRSPSPPDSPSVEDVVPPEVLPDLDDPEQTHPSLREDVDREMLDDYYKVRQSYQPMSPKRQREETPPLDPIPPDFCAKANNVWIQAAVRFPWQKLAISLYLGDIQPERMPERTPEQAAAEFPGRVNTHVKPYFGHLLNVGLLERIADPASASARSGLFLVPKRDLSSSRLIFDCRQGNSLFKKEYRDEFLLYTLEELLAVVARFLPERGVVLLWGDIRHFYHQLRFPEYARHFAAVFLDNRWYLPRSVPMGWQDACHWAQGVTLVTILAVLEGEPLLGVDEASLSRGKMPRVVWLYESLLSAVHKKDTRAAPGAEEKPVGALLVIMDGFLLFVPQHWQRRWKLRLERNFRDAALKLKQQLPFDSSAKQTKQGIHVSQRNQVVEFSGLEICLSKGWRCAKRLEDENVPVRATRRDIFTLLGRLNWQLRIRGAGRDKIAVLRSIWSYFSPPLSSLTKEWKATVDVPPEVRAPLQQLVDEVRATSEDWIQPPPQPKVDRCFAVISDAYTEGLGFVIIDIQGTVVHAEHIPQRGKQVLQEADAMVVGVRWLSQQYPGTYRN